MKFKVALALFFLSVTEGLPSPPTNCQEPPATPSTTPNPHDDPQGRAIKGTRILGGSKVEQGQVPYIVQMKGTNQRTHFCGGTLISPTCVLTAAHCLRDPSVAPYKIKFSVGVLKLTEVTATDHPVVQSQEVQPAHENSHELFDENTAENDIALVIMPQPFNISEPGIKHAFLGSKDLIDQKVIGRRARVSGWGKIRDDKYLSANRELMYVKQRVWTHEKCKETVPTLPEPECVPQSETDCKLKYFPGHLCAGGIENQDSCQGDSGGPLVVQDVQGNFHVVGVVSIGSGCGIEGHPGIYTNVGYYEEWIRSKCPDLPAPVKSRSQGIKSLDGVVLKDD